MFLLFLIFPSLIPLIPSLKAVHAPLHIGTASIYSIWSKPRILPILALTCGGRLETSPNSMLIVLHSVCDRAAYCGPYLHTNYSGRTKYSACASKLSKLLGEYLCPQKTQKAAVFFIRKIFGWRVN
jgi:hypothetical protein